MKRLAICGALWSVVMMAGGLAAQVPDSTGTIVISVRDGTAPLAGAVVRSGSSSVATDSSGSAALRLLAGERTVDVEAAGRKRTVRVIVPDRSDTALTVDFGTPSDGSRRVRTGAVTVIAVFLIAAAVRLRRRRRPGA